MARGKAGKDLLQEHGAVWRRAVVLVLLVVAVAALAMSDTLHELLMWILEASESFIAGHAFLGGVLFVLLAALSAMLAFVSAGIVVPVAVVAWGEPISVLLLWVGWIIGGMISYGLALWLGRAAVHWLRAEATLRRLEQRMQRSTPFGLVLLFQLALPSELPGYVLGLVRYNFAKYLLALSLAELPYALITVHVGASLVDRRTGLVLGMGLALVAVSVASLYLLRKRVVHR